MTDAATPRHEVRTRRRRSQTVCMADCQTSRRALPSSRRLLSRRSHSGGVGATCRQCGRNCVDISLQKPVGKHPVPNGRRGCELPLNGEPLAPSQTETVQLRCRLGSNRHGHVSRSEDGPVEGPSWGCRGDVGPLCYRTDPCSVLRNGRSLESVTFGAQQRGLRCTSATNGITCTKIGRNPGARGFRVAREGYALF